MGRTAFITAQPANLLYKGEYTAYANQFRPVTDGGGVAKDLMVVVANAHTANNTGGGSLTPSGWTRHPWTGGASGSQAWRANLYYRRLDGTETSQAQFIHSDYQYPHLVAWRFYGGGPVLTSGSGDADLDNGDPPAQTVTVAGLRWPLLVIGSAMAGGHMSDGVMSTWSFSPSADHDVTLYSNPGTAKTKVRTGFKIFNRRPENVTVNMGDEASNSGFVEGYNLLGSAYIMAGRTDN